MIRKNVQAVESAKRSARVRLSQCCRLALMYGSTVIQKIKEQLPKKPAVAPLLPVLKEKSVTNLLIYNKEFKRLWFGQILSRFGDNIEFIALMMLIYDLTGSALSMGMIAILNTLPSVFLRLLVGFLLIDMIGKKLWWSVICAGLSWSVVYLWRIF